MKKLALVLALFLACGEAQAQSNFGMPPPAGVMVIGAQVVASCAAGSLLTTAPAFLTVDQTGKLCTSSSGGGGGGLSVTDQASWTQAVSQFTPSGCEFNDASTLSSGQQGTVRCNTKRAFYFDTDTTGSNLYSAITASVPYGEFHIGEIGSNQIAIKVAQTVTASSAYTSGNALGGFMTIVGASRNSGSLGAAGTGGIISGMQITSKSNQASPSAWQADVFIFDASPTATFCNDKTAFVISGTDTDKLTGILTVPSTAANGAGWFASGPAAGNGSVAQATYYPITYDLASSTNLYACAVTRSNPTFLSTSDLTFKWNLLRN